MLGASSGHQPATACEGVGGMAAPKALSALFFRCCFCPAGGSWLVPVGDPDPARIEALARAVAALRRNGSLRLTLRGRRHQPPEMLLSPVSKTLYTI